MRKALYYPHTQIRDELFLKNSLLLWDQVEYISPTPHFSFDSATPKDMREAVELLCRSHVPTEIQKEVVHSRVVKLLENRVPNWLLNRDLTSHVETGRRIREFYGTSYDMYPQKLDPKTWDLLAHAKLIQPNASDYEYYANQVVGFFLMSLIAEACAGTQIEKITDRAEAYQLINGLVAAEAKATLASDADLALSQSVQRNVALDRLVTISIKVINTDDIPLKNILDMRKRELASGGHDYQQFRKNYGDKISSYVKRIVSDAKSGDDWREIERQFSVEMRNDLSFLHEELGVARQELIFSKEMLTTVLAAGSLFAEPISASIWLSKAVALGGGGAFIKDFSTLSGNYKSALRDHPCSWLYLAGSPKIRSAPFGNIV